MTRIAIIDDDPQVREAMKTILSKSGYEIALGKSGIEALQILENHPCELLITDIIMPDMEGLETIRKIKKQFPSQKIIAMSGGGRIQNTDFLPIAKKLGAEAVIYKPIDRKTLLDLIENQLET